MSMVIKPKLKCPYCGKEGGRAYRLEIFTTSKFMDFLTCDNTEGGCGETFVSELNVEVTARAAKLDFASAGAK